VKPNVYNFGLADPRDLKGTNLSHRKGSQDKNANAADAGDKTLTASVKAWLVEYL